METRDRKRVIFFVRIGLVVATIAFVFNWIGGKVSNNVKNVHVQSAPVVASLGPGDIQILFVPAKEEHASARRIADRG